MRAERHANAELASAQTHAVRQHAEQAERREPDRDGGERGENAQREHALAPRRVR